MRRFYFEAFNISVTVLGLIPEAKGITDKSEDSYEIKNLASPSVITAFKNLPTPKYVGAPQERKKRKALQKSYHYGAQTPVSAILSGIIDMPHF